METPSSTGRLTISQILATSNTKVVNTIPMSRKNGESEKGISKSRPRTGNQQDRSALIDISNDSPIVGLAIGSSVETPLSKKRNNNNQTKDLIKTPGSGEALLRGQVKTLLNSSGNEGFRSVTPSPAEEQLMTSQMETEIVEGTTEQEGLVCENSSITRSLLLDFTEKLEASDLSRCSFVLSNIRGENEGKEKSSTMEEDNASVWSVQVNASSKDDEEEDEDGIEEIDDDDEEEEKEGDDGGYFDELCEWMSNISVCEGPKFSGKHTRFVYNADDEIEVEEVCSGGENLEASFGASTGIVRLKGLPTPEGKHFRFPEEEEEDN